MFEKVLPQWQNAIGPKGQSEADFERPPAASSRSVAMLAIDARNLSRLPWIALGKRDLRRSSTRFVARPGPNSRNLHDLAPFFWLIGSTARETIAFVPQGHVLALGFCFAGNFSVGAGVKKFTAVGPPGLQIFRKY
jgi:hypothetical protein